MEPIKFKESTMMLRPSEEGHLSLWAFRDEEQIISCWHVGFSDIFRLIFRRKIWLYVFGMNHPPVWVATQYPFKREQEEGGGND